MQHPSHHHVILAEMTRAFRAGQPDADWHEVEPDMRAQWEHAPRGCAWSEVRGEAARHWRFGAAMAPCTVVPVPEAPEGASAFNGAPPP